MNILFFYPSNKRTIPIDIPLIELQKRGHKIFFLTTIEEGPYHQQLKEKGFQVFDHIENSKFKILKLLGQVRFLITFCKQHKIDVVHSHLQQANIIAAIVSLVSSIKIIIFRHHCKFEFLSPEDIHLKPNRNEKLADMIINRLAKKIIVPSKAVKQVMINRENVSEDKIQIINYIYDFNQIKKINQDNVDIIKQKFNAKLKIIMVSRLTLYKRHIFALKAIKNLLNAGLDLQVLIMDDGPQFEEINKFINENNLEDRVHLLGFKQNISDYLAACDIIIHPSLTEASNSAIKEAGILEKIVVVCKNVGDFDEYIFSGENGFLVEPANFDKQTEEIVKNIYVNPQKYNQMGSKLRNAIIEKFKLTNETINAYEAL